MKIALQRRTFLADKTVAQNNNVSGFEQKLPGWDGKSQQAQDSHDASCEGLRCMNETEHLKGRLEQTPDVRAVKVSWAKVLLSDPSYPQESVLNRVADVLSKHIEIPQGE